MDLEAFVVIICIMKFVHIVLISAIALNERSVTSFPYAYTDLFPYMAALPPQIAPVIRAPIYYPNIAYHNPYHELRNAAGATKRESKLLTDIIAMRLPASVFQLTE